MGKALLVRFSRIRPLFDFNYFRWFQHDKTMAAMRQQNYVAGSNTRLSR